jgi:hypothetical protein
MLAQIVNHDLAAASELSGNSRRDLLQQFQFSGFRAVSLLFWSFFRRNS